jgi:hypothetical protein
VPEQSECLSGFLRNSIAIPLACNPVKKVDNENIWPKLTKEYILIMVPLRQWIPGSLKQCFLTFLRDLVIPCLCIPLARGQKKFWKKVGK